MPTKSVWLGWRMCTLCHAGAKGGETENLVVIEESLPGTILSEEKAFWQGVASHEVCAGVRKLRRAAEVFADPEV